MAIKDYFQAPEGYVYVHKTLRLFGEIIYITDEVMYTKNEFKLVSNEDLPGIIEQWRIDNGNTIRG